MTFTNTSLVGSVHFDDFRDEIVDALFRHRGELHPKTFKSSDAYYIYTYLDRTIQLNTLLTVGVQFTYRGKELKVSLDSPDVYLVSIPIDLFTAVDIVSPLIKLIATAMVEICVALHFHRDFHQSPKLKQCIADRFLSDFQLKFPSGFELPPPLHDENEDEVRSSERSLVGYSYSGNSCFADSVLVPLYFSSDTHIRDILLDTDVGNLRWINTDGESIKICSEMRDDMTLKEKRVYAGKIQNAIREDIQQLENEEPTSCSNLRQLLLTCIPDMKVRGMWVTYNAVSLYSTLTDIFPSMKMTIPELVHNESSDEWKVRVFQKATLDVRDYVQRSEGPLTRGEVRILWDKISTPVLMFGHSSPLRYLSKTGVEELRFTVEGQTYSDKVVKTHAMGEFILGKKYRLFGAVILHGVRDEEGTHYTSIFRIDDQYYSYDDVNGHAVPMTTESAMKIFELPPTSYSKVNMLMYSKE